MKPRKTEHPILFITPMVQSILALLKRMTRRTKGLEKINKDPNAWYLQTLFLHATGRFTFAPVNTRHAITDSDIIEVKCPYGQPGDKLWVRETWQKYRAFGEDIKNESPIIYKADQDECGQFPCLIDGEIVYVNDRESWKPSIHMPKAAARIWLIITDVRVERLQDISHDDAKNEGIAPLLMSNTQIIQHGQLYQNYFKSETLFNDGVSPIPSFYSLWCKINGTESLEANPWVWVIEFKQIEK